MASTMSSLFHYCTVSTFSAIVSTGKVRMSSMRQSNDATEGALVAEAVTRLARRAGCSQGDLDSMQQRARDLESKFDGMALCMSEDADALSQWRGYADDGQGLAIGFSRAYLDNLVAASESDDTQFGLNLYQAKYNPEEHDAAIEPLFSLLRDYAPDRTTIETDDERVAQLSQRIQGLQELRLLLEVYDQVFSLKHQAFVEEREWRLLHHFSWQHDQPDGFHPGRSRLVPYVEFALPMDSVMPIAEVVLGPRHTSPSEVVRQFLHKHGHRGVSLRRSCAPYRRDA